MKNNFRYIYSLLIIILLISCNKDDETKNSTGSTISKGQITATINGTTASNSNSTSMYAIINQGCGEFEGGGSVGRYVIYFNSYSSTPIDTGIPYPLNELSDFYVDIEDVVDTLFYSTSNASSSGFIKFEEIDLVNRRVKISFACTAYGLSSGSITISNGFFQFEKFSGFYPSNSVTGYVNMVSSSSSSFSLDPCGAEAFQFDSTIYISAFQLDGDGIGMQLPLSATTGSNYTSQSGQVNIDFELGSNGNFPPNIHDSSFINVTTHDLNARRISGFYTTYGLIPGPPPFGGYVGFSITNGSFDVIYDKYPFLKPNTGAERNLSSPNKRRSFKNLFRAN